VQHRLIHLYTSMHTEAVLGMCKQLLTARVKSGEADITSVPWT
jgi:hypothetical protein